MLCEKCSKNDATIHYISDVNSEMHICEVCAKGSGLNSQLSDFSQTVSEIISFIDINEIEDINSVNRCNRCGFSIIDYKKTGKLGCSECYSYLSESLEPVISGCHGSKKHIGKVPHNLEINDVQMAVIDNPIDDYDLVADLQVKLELAISEERYEDAAVIRDKIRDESEE
ncbi:UvrB/UvrC motif-containing protein [Spirochaetota bacterium]